MLLSLLLRATSSLPQSPSYPGHRWAFVRQEGKGSSAVRGPARGSIFDREASGRKEFQAWSETFDFLTMWPKSSEEPGQHLQEVALGAEPAFRCEPTALRRGGEGQGRCPLSPLAGACIYWKEDAFLLSYPGGGRGRRTLLLGYFFTAPESAFCCESLSPHG